jgi:hypothetical protein
VVEFLRQSDDRQSITLCMTKQRTKRARWSASRLPVRAITERQRCDRSAAHVALTTSRHLPAGLHCVGASRLPTTTANDDIGSARAARD